MGCTCLFRFIDCLVIFDMSFFSIGKRFISRIFLEKNRTCSQGHRFGNKFPLRKEKPRLRRGLLNAVCLIFFRHGLTPAHAGKICATTCLIRRSKAHPCVDRDNNCSVQKRKAHPRLSGENCAIRKDLLS